MTAIDIEAFAPTITIQQQGATATITTHTGQAHTLDLYEGKPIADAATKFSKSLEVRVRKVGDAVSPDAGKLFVQKSIDLAETCIREACRGERRRLLKFIEIVQSEIAIAMRLNEEPPSVHIVAHDEPYLPWELLMATDALTTKGEFYGTATLNMAATCTRLTASQDEPVTRLQSEYPAKISVFHHRTITAFREEAAFFKGDRQHFACAGPTAPGSDGLAADQLARNILAPERPVESGEQRLSTNHIVHVGCHHQLDKIDTSNFLNLNYLNTAMHFDKTDKTYWVRFTELDEAMWRMQKQAGSDVPLARPFIFLNACRGQYHPWIASSFAQLLAKYAVAGVVGTVAKIPAAMAVAFGRFFYSALLTNQTVPEAVRFAGEEVRRVTGSPIGLIYVYTGVPELRLV